jgi:thiamine kinase-like enzyme
VEAVGELNDILRGLEPALGRLGGDPVPLEGGITNRNFKVRFGDGEYVVRLHGTDTELLGISRDAERAACDAAAALGIAPELAANFEGGAVTRYVRCAPLRAHEIAARAEEIAVALRAFHRCAVVLPARFWVPDLLDSYASVVADRGGRLPDTYAEARELSVQIVAALPPDRHTPCHNDLLPGNLLRERDHDQIMIVDWEYAGMGHPSFDLGNLSVNNEFDEAADERLLGAYHGAAPSPAQRATLQLMRLLSDVREAAWGVMQAAISDLTFDFDGYAERHFRRLRAATADGRLGSWLAAAAG